MEKGDSATAIPLSVRLAELPAQNAIAQLIIVNEDLRVELVVDTRSTVSSLRGDLLAELPEKVKSSVAGPEYLRIIFLGRILPEDATLAACGVLPKKQSVLHASIRPADMPIKGAGKAKKEKEVTSANDSNACCCAIL